MRRADNIRTALLLILASALLGVPIGLVWARIAPLIEGGRLARLVLWETPRNSAEYTGE